MAGFIVAAIVVIVMVGIALWRPEIAVMALGAFLFVQSALMRLEGLPDQLRTVIERGDEIVLLALLLRITLRWWLTRSRLPRALWGLIAFAAVGVISAAVNDVGPFAMGLGIFLAVKAGLWLYVGRLLFVNTRVLARYAYFLGVLFVGAVAIGALQFLGVPMPWDTTPRAGVMAATSIWNQHTAFGGALSVAMGLSVAAFRLPGERIGAAILAIVAGGGIVLSTARRLLASIAVAFVAVALALPRGERINLIRWRAALRRPAVLLLLLLALAFAGVVVVPRLVNVATYTWEKYVVELQKRDRYQLYVGAFRLVQHSPLVGRGPATYGSYASVVVDSPAYEEVGFRRRNANMVVGGQIGSIAAEYGLLGLLAFASFLAFLVGELLPIARRSTGTIQAGLAMGGVFMVVDMIVESVANPVFSNSFITFFSFIGMGVAINLHDSPASQDRSLWQPDRLSTRWRVAMVGAAGLLLASLVLLALIAVPSR